MTAECPACNPPLERLLYAKPGVVPWGPWCVEVRGYQPALLHIHDRLGCPRVTPGQSVGRGRTAFSMPLRGWGEGWLASSV